MRGLHALTCASVLAHRASDFLPHSKEKDINCALQELPVGVSKS